MAKVTVGLPQGTRDFGPDVVRKRNYILSTIRNVFELYGFQPLETPAMENLDTLMGKYGEEGDKLIFKILNNGLDNPEKEKQVRDDFEKVLRGKNNKGITERALKYDLTIPFARYVAMNHSQLTFPFKRYQVQPVWRADRPQKGRYREFYQCDADVVGSKSLMNEVELINIYFTVFEKLNIDCTIKINNRKVLTGITELTGKPITTKAFASIIDKLDKVGIDKIKSELFELGFTQNDWTKIEKFLKIADETPGLHQFASLKMDSSIAAEGIDEVSYVISHLSDAQKKKIVFNSSLARGLDYYTGCIFEVKANNVQMGSIGGGGRYDDLTGLFGVPNIPGVGISFGVDRIYDVMEELQLFPEEVHIGTQVLFFNLGTAESKVAFSLLQPLREKGVRGELYHENSKFDKQFKYAEKKNIPYVVILGEEEVKAGPVKLKNIKTGEQQTLSQEALINFSFI